MPPPAKRESFSDESVSNLLGRAYYLHLGLLEKVLRDEGLSKDIRPGMCNVLFALFAEDGQTISSIANRIKVAKSTMTGTVGRLKATGLVKVNIDPQDRRAQRLALTAKAKKLESSLQRACDKLELIICEGLSATEQKSLRALLGKSIKQMEESV